MDEDRHPEVPDLKDPLLVEFAARYQLQSGPVHLTFTDLGYPPSQCHLSAKHRAKISGGRRVHGWAVWKFNDFLLAEHHSVWDDGNQLSDVTPPKFGGDRILFIRDDISDLVEMEGLFVMWCDRTTLAHADFLYNNEAIKVPTWGLRPDNPAVTNFCAQYGLTPADMLTDPTYG